MRTPRPSRAGQLASIQTTPAVAAKFRREADKLGLKRHVFLAILLRQWRSLPDDGTKMPAAQSKYQEARPAPSPRRANAPAMKHR